MPCSKKAKNILSNNTPNHILSEITQFTTKLPPQLYNFKVLGCIKRYGKDFCEVNAMKHLYV